LPQLRRSNSYGLCPTIIEIQHNLMPYFTRIKEMDWVVGAEPTTSAFYSISKKAGWRRIIASWYLRGDATAAPRLVTAEPN
jgi:hypothetical protein